MNKFGVSPLLPLTELPHPVAGLVKSYLEYRSDWKVGEYFLRRIEAYFSDENLQLPSSFDIEAIDIDNQTDNSTDVRMVSVRANYFRGFRKHEKTIDISGDLVVIEGLNSSGKTSLAEAIEWVVTGEICRRQMGDSKELSACIANRFKRENEDTWVESIISIDGRLHTLKRLLTHDYESKKASTCKSRLFLDGTEVLDSAEYVIKLFSGATPLLMQHTLREFLFADPSQRRAYFEQLFNLDDITSLIATAVVGETGLGHFQRKNGGDMLAKWGKLSRVCTNTDAAIFTTLQQDEQSLGAGTLDTALREIAVRDFGLDRRQKLVTMTDRIEDLQRQGRESKFPHLSTLEPRRSLDQASLAQLTTDSNDLSMQRLKDAEHKYATALQSTQQLTVAQEAVSRTLQILQEANLITDIEYQTCPLCEYTGKTTLSRTRIDSINLLSVTREKLSTAESDLRNQVATMRQVIADLVKLRRGLLPTLPSDSIWERAKQAELEETVSELRTEYFTARDDLSKFDDLCQEIEQCFIGTNLPDEYEIKLVSVFSQLESIRTHARIYRAKFDEFETRLGELAASDKIYAARETWLDVSKNAGELLADLRWEAAKRHAKHELDMIRDGLKAFRLKILGLRKVELSEGMDEVWSILRKDVYAGFKQIWIPKPEGRGFPVKIEVKAVLDDGSETHEVDALNVLSESQTNAICIAAFITRSRLLGHRCIVFDDPVQSLDDEHVRSFANKLLCHLCELGFQTIILTHNDRFAREISHFHYHRLGYVTNSIRFSQEEGIVISEGNRRVSERLKAAEKIAKDGDLERAWYFVRLALERLYLLAMLKHGRKQFDPFKWSNHSAEAMWNEGVDRIVDCYAPDSKILLKDILDMTAHGAHDKKATSFGDVMQAIKDVRPLMSKLRVGEG